MRSFLECVFLLSTMMRAPSLIASARVAIDNMYKRLSSRTEHTLESSFITMCHLCMHRNIALLPNSGKGYPILSHNRNHRKHTQFLDIVGSCNRFDLFWIYLQGNPRNRHCKLRVEVDNCTICLRFQRIDNPNSYQNSRNPQCVPELRKLNNCNLLRRAAKHHNCHKKNRLRIEARIPWGQAFLIGETTGGQKGSE